LALGLKLGAWQLGNKMSFGAKLRAAENQNQIKISWICKNILKQAAKSSMQKQM